MYEVNQVIKPTKAYKMSSRLKRELATYTDPHIRGMQKRIMIQAELIGAQQVKREKKKYEPRTDEE